ncbi:hypothetical protein ANCCAN_24020 [Ancylostoma caninum]|uniref:Uncharacterized protein n=1 Tax=Ancylostoma caninum TaxID=29170 RepID=A0A368FDG6_ANCCA|nr:hypothetical protein ANCCAN_24020 [Ancylostoma caninum]
MKQRGFFIYYRYFSSVEKIAMTALEIVWDRIRIAEALERTRWNHLHPHEMLLTQQDIVILWPHLRGVPPVGADFGTRIPLEFVDVINRTIDVNSLKMACDRGFVMFIDERLNPPKTEMNAVLEYSKRNPNRMVGVHGIEFDWQKGQVAVGRVYNGVLFSLVVFHSWYLSEHVSPIPLVLWNECLPAVLNVVVTERSMLPPMVVGERTQETWLKPEVDVSCYRRSDVTNCGNFQLLKQQGLVLM